MADDLHANGEFEAARTEAIRVLALARGNQALERRLGTWLADLGAFVFATGRTARGLELFEQGLDELISQSGQDHPEVLDYRAERLEFGPSWRWPATGRATPRPGRSRRSRRGASCAAARRTSARGRWPAPASSPRRSRSPAARAVLQRFPGDLRARAAADAFLAASDRRTPAGRPREAR